MERKSSVKLLDESWESLMGDEVVTTAPIPTLPVTSGASVVELFSKEFMVSVVTSVIVYVSVSVRVWTTADVPAAGKPGYDKLLVTMSVIVE